MTLSLLLLLIMLLLPPLLLLLLIPYSSAYQEIYKEEELIKYSLSNSTIDEMLKRLKTPEKLNTLRNRGHFEDRVFCVHKHKCVT
jgi:hypothetical protein